MPAPAPAAAWASAMTRRTARVRGRQRRAVEGVVDASEWDRIDVIFGPCCAATWAAAARARDGGAGRPVRTTVPGPGAGLGRAGQDQLGQQQTGQAGVERAAGA
jgi:hypothetical protein